MGRLDRFHEAQADLHAGFATALRELQAGRKTGHWIWYVFPQLAGLGHSSTAVHYGLADEAEATDYLRDPVLGDRLVQAAAAARRHLTGPGALSVVVLMGSVIDAHKLVSSMTLFGHVAHRLEATSGEPRFAAMAEHARAILAAAAPAGYEPCAFTAARLGRSAADRPEPGPR
jgi:uncharacterized protein (DUF1810 family)